MLPGSLVALISLLLILAPGIAFQMLRERKRPALVESPLREAGRIALASLVFGGLALAILAGARAVWPERLPDPGAWIAAPSQYAAKHYGRIGIFLAAHVLIALALAALAHWHLSRGERTTILPRSVWYQAFRADAPPRTTVQIQATIADGSIYVGNLAAYTSQPTRNERELLLAPPIFVKQPGNANLERAPRDWQRLVLPGEAVAALAVAYRPVNQRSPGRTPLRRRLRAAVRAVFHGAQAG